MLEHDMKEANDRKIEIEDAEPDTVEAFLGYLYEPKVLHLDVELASNLMSMADKYNVHTLVKACQGYLWDNLGADNLVQVAIVGHLCKEDQLKDAAISKMISSEVRNLRSLKDWKKLAGYPELFMDIAEQMKNEFEEKKREFVSSLVG